MEGYSRKPLFQNNQHSKLYRIHFHVHDMSALAIIAARGVTLSMLHLKRAAYRNYKIQNWYTNLRSLRNLHIKNWKLWDKPFQKKKRDWATTRPFPIPTPREDATVWSPFDSRKFFRLGIVFVNYTKNFCRICLLCSTPQGEQGARTFSVAWVMALLTEIGFSFPPTASVSIITFPYCSKIWVSLPQSTSSLAVLSIQRHYVSFQTYHVC